MARLPMRSYFLYETKKNCIHLRAWSKKHTCNMQFTRIWRMVQHLDLARTFTFRIMLTVTIIHTPTLTTTRHQKEQIRQPQSWLVRHTSHLMTGRCFILVKIPLPSKTLYLACDSLDSFRYLIVSALLIYYLRSST